MQFLFINVNHDVGYESSECIPISLGYILAVLKEQGREGVILDDVRDRPLSLNELEKWIRRVVPKVIGFTAYQSTMPRIRFLARYIKSRHPEILVVLGGPQIIAMPSEGLEDLADTDLVIRSEAEIVMPALADALENGKPLNDVFGITFRQNNHIIDTDPGPDPPEELDTYPSPYLTDLLNLEGKNTAIMLSSRGCSHVCWFCITPRICKGKVRYHSVERTVAEMEHLSKQGIERFWFADPNFTEDPDRTRRLLEAKLRRGIGAPFWCQTRSDMIDLPLIKDLREAGADTLAFGLESGSPGVLEKSNKATDLDRVREQIAYAQSLGMETELFSIFGLPGETVDDARATLEFVRSLNIPIQSNSGSQQMQLYFGSVFAKNPERHGFKLTDGYKPRYLSIGEDYETQEMTTRDMRRVRNIWALANEQMEQDVYMKQRLFEVLDFLTANRDDLKEEPKFYVFGALASSSLEEFDLLVDFLEGYERLEGKDAPPVLELVSGLNFFRETTGPAGSTDRLIFDSRSWMDGVPFTGISGKYWDVLLGRELLLPEFEEGFRNARAGQDVEFSFTFPDDYSHEELRGKTVDVLAKIHKVFTSEKPKTVAEVKGLGIRNTFDFKDLDLLQDHNDILYYFALRDADPDVLLKKPRHFLMLVHRLAKLGRHDRIESMAALVADKPTALKALADTLTRAGKCAWAIGYYDRLSDEIPSSRIKKAQCLINTERYDEALTVMESIPDSPDSDYRQTLLECLKRARPTDADIPALEHNVMNMRVQAALDRDRIPRSGGSSAPPIVHGTDF